MMKCELEATANCAKMSREEDPIVLIKNINTILETNGMQLEVHGTHASNHLHAFSVKMKTPRITTFPRRVQLKTALK